MDNLFEKLFSPIKHSETSLIRKFTGSQAFARNSLGVFQNLPAEFQQELLEDSLFATDFKNNPPSRSLKLSIHDLFRTFNHIMLPHIPQMAPCPDLLQEYRRLINKASAIDTVVDSISDFSAILDSMASKTVEKLSIPEIAHKSSIVSVADASSPNKKAQFNVTSSLLYDQMVLSVANASLPSDKDSCVAKAQKKSSSDQLVVSIADADLPNDKDPCTAVAQKKYFPDQLVVSVTDTSLPNDKDSCVAQKKSFSDQLIVSIADASSPDKKSHFNVTVSRTLLKPAPKDDCAFNQQMATRKNKELQKRSKKRRRRQKKSNNQSSNSVPKNYQNNKVMANCDDNCKSPLPSNKSNSKSCDILCDMTVSPKSASVQVTLPNLSSFVVTIEGSDDDSDWDSACDADWHVEDSEFQVSGLFVASFSATNACIPITKHEEENLYCKELDLMKARLDRVNRIWNETTDCLKTKPKSTTKVSFAIDEELEEICPVEMYERKGEWEIYAIERLRFKKRIAEVGDILNPCLQPDHRAKVYSTLCRNVL